MTYVLCNNTTICATCVWVGHLTATLKVVCSGKNDLGLYIVAIEHWHVCSMLGLATIGVITDYGFA